MCMQKNDDPSSARTFYVTKADILLNYITKEYANCVKEIFDANIRTKIIESFCSYI